MAKKEKKLSEKKKDNTSLVVNPSKDKKFNQESFNKQLQDTDELMLYKCPNCRGVHFRHAGYVEQMTPYIALEPDMAVNSVKSSTNSLQVKVCVACKFAFVDIKGKMFDISKHIDLSAWEKTEKEMTKATGPGGEC